MKIKGISNRQCADLLLLSRNTVNEYVKCLSAVEEDLEALLGFTEDQLRDLFPQADTKDNEQYEALLAFLPVANEERLHPRFTYLNKWYEYKALHPTGYGYTQFMCHYHRLYDEDKGSMRLEHIAGERIYVDYAGKKAYIVDRATGEQLYL